jgi:site-specific DNA-methyltransferase (adenine-specific)
MNKHLSEVTNEDCMEGMARYPDKYFDLAIVDPPYGIGVNKWLLGDNKPNNRKHTKGKKWDIHTPDLKYFNELKRICKNQIIWGGNYFTDKLPISMGWIYWDKLRNEGLSFSDGELAWTSFNRTLKSARIQYDGFLGMDKERIHPTQKPVALYKWLLQNYAKQGDKILDTHLGSGSSRIAAYEMGFDFTAFELDKEYFEAQEKRYKAHIAQLKMELV